MTEKDFSLRLAQLREKMGVSARDMSLSMGQNPGYINNIENRKMLPSLNALFHICDYFGITPKEFFDTEISDPGKAHELLEAIRGLNTEQVDTLISLAKNLKRQ